MTLQYYKISRSHQQQDFKLKLRKARLINLFRRKSCSSIHHDNWNTRDMLIYYDTININKILELISIKKSVCRLWDKCDIHVSRIMLGLVGRYISSHF